MQIAFAKLFQVAIFHNFYTSKIGEDFRITPTDNCRRLLNKYRLLFKETATGFTVLYEIGATTNDTAHPLVPIAEEVRFSFMLQSNNPYLVNYSKLPLDVPDGRMYYLSNLNDNVKEGKLLLQAAASGDYLSSQDLIELKPQIFDYSDKSAKTSVDLEIQNQFSDPLIERSIPVLEGKFSYPVKLRPYGPGQYRLLIDGGEAAKFYASDELTGKNVFGLIDIFRSSHVPAVYQFTDAANNHDVTAKNYTIQIDNRKTVWKYFVVLKYSLFKDKSPDKWPAQWHQKVHISYPSAPPMNWPPLKDDLRTMADGRRAIPFESHAELPLRQKPIKGIQLAPQSENDGFVSRIENLPNPSITQIKPDKSDNKIYSEIFVYT